MSQKVSAKSGLVERIDPEAKVIHVAALDAGRGATFATERAIELDEVDERCASAELMQPDRFLHLLDMRAEYVAVEFGSASYIPHAQHNVIEPKGAEG